MTPSANRPPRQSLPRDGRQSLPRDGRQSLPRDGRQSLPRAALLLVPFVITACDGSGGTSYNPPTTGSSTGTSAGGGGSGAGGSGASGGTGGEAGGGGTGSSLCGNGIIDPGEACDGAAAGGATCEMLGYPGGQIGCTAACELDISSCTGADDCTDGIDNDGDMLIDCDEADCRAACADACAAPPVLLDPDDVFGSTLGHADTVQASCGAESGGDVVYTITASTTGVLDIVLVEDGSAGFTLSARTDCASAASEIACTDAFTTGAGLSKKLSLPVTAGQVLFVVVDTNGAGAEGKFSISAQSHAVECGDGIQDPPEACDDGNLDAGDGCGPTCALEAMEPEPNDTLATAASYTSPYFAAIDPEGDVDLVKVTLPASGGLVITVAGLGDFACVDGTMDSVVTLLDAAGSPIATNDDASAATLCSKLAVAGLPAGDYFVRIEAAVMAPPAAATFPYALTIDTSACGDGVISPGEECDGDVTQGAPSSQYACTAACAFAADETEPNGTLASADVYTPSAPGSPPAKWIARIDPDGDVDVVSLNVPGPASKITARTYSPDGGPCWPTADTFIEILDAAGALLQSNDDNALGYCSLAAATNLAAGKYHVRVRATPTLDMTEVYIFPYALEITVE